MLLFLAGWDLTNPFSRYKNKIPTVECCVGILCTCVIVVNVYIKTSTHHALKADRGVDLAHNLYYFRTIFFFCFPVVFSEVCACYDGVNFRSLLFGIAPV